MTTYDTRNTAAIYLGYTSVFLWILCMFPQLVLNCRNGKSAALSIYFFIFWLFGDSFNLIGSILTNQLMFQKISCCIFIIGDILNLLQYMYFKGDYKILHNSSVISPTLLAFTLIVANTEAAETKGITTTTTTTILEATTAILEATIPTTTIDRKTIIGIIFGSIAGTMYILSRLIQLIKIQNEKSVKGLYKSMFIVAILANTCTINALFLKSKTAQDLLVTSPWIITSFSVLVFDFIILYYFYLFRVAEVEVESLLEDPTINQSNSP